MRLHHVEDANSYTFIVSEEELSSAGFPVNSFVENQNINIESAMLFASLGDFFLYTLAKYEGTDAAKEMRIATVQNKKNLFYYHMRASSAEDSWKIGPIIFSNISFTEEMKNYLLAYAETESKSTEEDNDGDNDLCDEDFSILFHSLNEAIDYCKVIPEDILKSRVTSSFVKVKDGYCLIFYQGSGLTYTDAGRLIALADEWRGSVSAQIYEDFEDFHLEDPIKTFRDL